ncbi:MAG: DUF1667 domain-containing protein [Negativicutes bacterium]|nr:DUF1667 domain-containing protein [Negativicutes bacterium]
MNKTRKITCIVCPLGCEGEVRLDQEGNVTTDGFTCKRGLSYAREELTAPKRMLTTTVRVAGGDRLLPVVSDRPLPKDKIRECARLLTAVTVEAPVAEGQVICPDILGLGVNIIASREIKGAAG